MKKLIIIFSLMLFSFASAKEIYRDQYYKYDINGSVLFVEESPAFMLFTMLVKPNYLDTIYEAGVSCKIYNSYCTVYKMHVLRKDGAYVHNDGYKEEIKKQITANGKIIAAKIYDTYTNCYESGIQKLTCNAK